MRNKIIALVAALGIAFTVATPAAAWYRGGWGGGYHRDYHGWGHEGMERHRW